MGKVLDTLKMIGIGIGVLGVATLEALSETALEDKNENEIGYSDVIESISNSNMYQSDIGRVIINLPKDESSEFYKGIKSIIESELWPSEKARVILALIKKQ